MDINLGGLASGYLATTAQLDNQEAQRRINTLRDQSIAQNQREADALKASDEYLRSAVAASQPAAAGVTAPQADAPAPAAVAQAGVLPQAPQATQDQQPQFTPDPRQSPVSAALGQPQASPAPKSMSPVVAALGVNPQQAPGSSSGAAIAPNPLPAPAKPASGSLAPYATAIDAAMKDGNPAAADVLRKRYVAALNDDLTRSDAEFNRQMQPLLQAGKQAEVMQAAATGPLLRRQQDANVALLALRLNPGDPTAAAFADNALLTKGAYGIATVPDVQPVLGPDGKPVAGPDGQPLTRSTMMAVVVDKSGNPVNGIDGKPFVRPADEVFKRMMSAPGGAVLAPQMQEWETKADQGTIYSAPKQVPIGTVPPVVVKQTGPGPVQQEAINSRVTGEVSKGVDTLKTLVSSPAAMSIFGNIQQQYQGLYTQATARIEKIVNQQHAAGRTPMPQEAANTVWAALQRAVAIQNANPKAVVTLDSVMGDVPPAPKPSQSAATPGSADYADYFQKKYGISPAR